MSAFFNGVTNEQLTEVGILEGLGEEALEKIKQCSYFIGVHPGLHIIRADDTGFELYVILSGTADVVRGGEVVSTLGKGDVFGEMAILGGSHRNADVVATSVMSLLSLTATELGRVTSEFPELERRIRDLAEGRRTSTA